MSDRDAFRAEQQERRQFGKAKQHEKRLENATYTAAEVKVLTETATRLGRELGKAEAWEQIADEISLGEDWQVEDPRISYVDVQIDKEGYLRLEEIRAARSQPSGAASDATSGVPRHSEVSEDRQAVRKRYPHAHACVTCSPDGRQPGPGCINCRQTGWDQTPCQAEGHKAQCPHDCCDPNMEVS